MYDDAQRILRADSCRPILCRGFTGRTAIVMTSRGSSRTSRILRTLICMPGAPHLLFTHFKSHENGCPTSRLWDVGGINSPNLTLSFALPRATKRGALHLAFEMWADQLSQPRSLLDIHPSTPEVRSFGAQKLSPLSALRSISLRDLQLLRPTEIPRLGLCAGHLREVA